MPRYSSSKYLKLSCLVHTYLVRMYFQHASHATAYVILLLDIIWSAKASPQLPCQVQISRFTFF
jgi:hypothetical protein